MLKSPLDLSQLSLDRAPTNHAPHKPLQQKKRWISRYGLPIAILVGFAVLLASAAGDRLMPARSVTIMPVIVKRAEMQQAGSTLFQSPGWIEPRPTAISVAAMAPGVIEELMVVAGQS
ncbi:MAG: hemolysin D, partial [Pirellula sp.]